jgi:hypothetical protein
VLATLRDTMAELERVAPAFVAADGFRLKARQTETLVGEVANDADFFAGVLDGPKKKKRHQKNEQKRLLRDEIQTALRETCSMLREGSGRGKHSDLFAEQAVSRADVVFATLSSSGQAVVSRAENFRLPHRGRGGAGAGVRAGGGSGAEAQAVPAGGRPRATARDDGVGDRAPKGTRQVVHAARARRRRRG